MKRRRKMTRRTSRKNFRRGAIYSHKFNTSARPLRGGTRL